MRFNWLLSFEPTVDNRHFDNHKYEISKLGDLDVAFVHANWVRWPRARKYINCQSVAWHPFSLTVIMLKLSLLCVLAFAVANSLGLLLDGGRDTRIIGGQYAAVNQFPFQASIQNKSSVQHLCGASIIHQRYLLTNGACVQNQFSDPAELSASVGSRTYDYGGTEYEIEKVIPHPRYSEIAWQNDIALLRTKINIVFNSQTVKPIKLPSREPARSLDVVMSGWGQFTVSTDSFIWISDAVEYIFLPSFVCFQYPLDGTTDVVSRTLRFFRTRTIPREECIRRHGHNSRLIHPNTICTNNGQKQGVCMGDFGGAAIDPKENVLVGVSSWNIPCGRGFPDVYQRVFPHVGWINLYVPDEQWINRRSWNGLSIIV